MTADRAAAAPRQKYRTLDDFERLYDAVGPDNYGWFQGKFFERVAQVHKVKGLAFIEEVRRAFPADEVEPLPAEVVIRRLEQISPGFIDWSQGLQ
jgi:hypothetical protein